MIPVILVRLVYPAAAQGSHKGVPLRCVTGVPLVHVVIPNAISGTIIART